MTRGRYASGNATFLGQHLVEGSPARLRITARIRDTELVELLLHYTVFTVRAVQRKEDYVCVRGQVPLARNGIEFMDNVADRTEGPRGGFAGAQRNFAFGR